MADLLVNIKAFSQALKNCEDITGSYVVDVSIENDLLQVSSFKDATYYKESLPVNYKDKFEFSVNLSLLKAFIGTKEGEVKISKDVDHNELKVSVGRSRSKIPLINVNREYFNADMVEDSIELNQAMVSKIFDSLDHFNFVSKDFNPNAIMQIQVLNNKLTLCTFEYFYSAMLIDDFKHSDFDFNINLKYMFILKDIFDKSNIKISTSSSKVIFENDKIKIILPKVADNDAPAIKDIMLDYQENTKQENMQAVVAIYEVEKFLEAYSKIHDFYRHTYIEDNRVNIIINEENMLLNIKNENGELDSELVKYSEQDAPDKNLLNIKYKIKQNINFGCNIKALRMILKPLHVCKIKFYENRLVVFSGNFVYQLLRLD